MANLTDLDTLEITILIDNELDPISPAPNPTLIQQTGGFREISQRGPALTTRGEAVTEMPMHRICCAAHGLSLLITGVKDDRRRTLLFDTGPTEAAWEANVSRLGVDVGDVERVHLSHWHRDHSGGLLRAVRMIGEAGTHPVVVDLHPDRPEYRGIRGPPVVSWEADPSFEAIEAVGGKVETSGEVHEVLGGFFAVSGGIPRVTGYEGGLRRGVRFVSGGGGEGEGRWESDEEIADERFVMCRLKDKGIVMFTGCSHAGVVNASRHAVELGHGAPLYAVMGGYHLADGEPELITKSVADLKALDPKLLIAGHCTGWRAKFRIQEEMPGRLVPSFVGNKLVL